MSDLDLWMEYEGIGCPEIALLRTNASSIIISSLNNEIPRNIFPGTIQNMLREKLTIGNQMLVENIDEDLVDVLINNILSYWDRVDKFMNIESYNNVIHGKFMNKNIIANLSWSSLQVSSLKNTLSRESLNGNLSICIQYMILESITAAYYKKELLPHLLNQLVDLLIKSQEYKILKKISSRILILHKSQFTIHMVKYAENIINKDKESALNMIIQLSSWKTNNTETQLNKFHILNQSAFCSKILGNNDLALKLESQIINSFDNTFFCYIACINTTRLLINSNNLFSIISLTLAYKYISKLRHNENYKRIILVYMSKIFPELKSSILFIINQLEEVKKDHYSMNWRLAQSLSKKNYYSNYLSAENKNILQNHSDTVSNQDNIFNKNLDFEIKIDKYNEIFLERLFNKSDKIIYFNTNYLDLCLREIVIGRYNIEIKLRELHN